MKARKKLIHNKSPVHKYNRLSWIIIIAAVAFLALLNYTSYREMNITGFAVSGNTYDTNYYDIARTTQAECQSTARA